MKTIASGLTFLLFSFSLIALGQDIKVQVSPPSFTGSNVHRDVQIVYHNLQLSPGSRVTLYFAYRTQSHGASANPVSGFLPQGGEKDQWCRLLIVSDWQSEQAVLMTPSGRDSHEYSAFLPLDGRFTSDEELSQVQFFVRLDSAGKTVDDRPFGDRGYYFVEIPSVAARVDYIPTKKAEEKKTNSGIPSEVSGSAPNPKAEEVEASQWTTLTVKAHKQSGG